MYGWLPYRLGWFVTHLNTVDLIIAGDGTCNPGCLVDNCRNDGGDCGLFYHPCLCNFVIPL